MACDGAGPGSASGQGETGASTGVHQEMNAQPEMNEASKPNGSPATATCDEPTLASGEEFWMEGICGGMFE